MGTRQEGGGHEWAVKIGCLVPKRMGTAGNEAFQRAKRAGEFRYLVPESKGDKGN